MDYNFKTTNQEDVPSVFSSYFEYFTNLYGPSFFTRVCSIAISSGHFEVKSLAAVDQAYGYTKDIVTSANKEGLKIIAIQDSDGKNIGYFRIRFITIEGVSLACVAELVLANDLSVERIDALKEMIQAIEEKVSTTYIGIERLDFEAGANDHEMQLALIDLGFNLLLDENNKQRITYMYEKPLKEKKATRE